MATTPSGEHPVATTSVQGRDENLSRFFEYVSDFLFVLDGQGAIMRVNSSVLERLGYTLEELVGQPVLVVHPPERREEAGRIVQEMVAGGRETCDVPLQTKDGELIPVETRVTVGTWDGEPAFYGVSRDISDRVRAETERLALERQILQSQKLESLGVLAGGIAHDFNNILMSVMGNASMALDELPATSPARKSIQDIEVASRRAAELCRQMLAYSGKGNFVIETIDVGGLVEEMAHLLQTSVSKKALLRIRPEPSLPTIRGDASQIRQIAMNLVMNASEAVEERSGIITLSTGLARYTRDELGEMVLGEDLQGGEYVFLEVVDTGCGMDEVTLDRLFEPFFTTKFTGRGLGMSAVLGIVRGHGGAVSVQSTVGMGTTFRVLFPLAADAVEDPMEQSVDAAVWRGQGHVLLVDDEETVRTLARRMLERIGYTVSTAEDGREALEVYRERMDEIDFVLLDLTMPRMDGREAFEALREMDPSVTVIVSSGYTEHEIQSRFQASRPDGFVQKPYSLTTLREFLHRFHDDGASSGL